MRSRAATWLISFSSLLFAALGNVFGNPVADALPAAWKNDAEPALIVATLTLFIAAIYLGSAQNDSADPYKRRSRIRRLLTIVVIVVTQGLSAVAGILANVVAATLPAQLKPYALPVFSAGIVVVTGAALLLYWLQQAPATEETNRAKFLKGVLERYRQRELDTLRGAVTVTLDLQTTSAAIAQPGLKTDSLAIGHAEPGSRSIEQIYDAAGEHLLILGEPGAGKSSQLTALALALVRRARDNAQRPIPVMFNLSTWAINRQPLDQWLVEDLVDFYQVSRKVAQVWVAEHMILPLLDGLDEVQSAQREACAQAINTFLAAHPTLPLVVCSRTAELRELAVALALPTQVVVQPLTDAQIMNYLAQGGAKMAALQTAVANDADLRDVLRTPLMLSIALLTYEEIPQAAIPPFVDRDAWRQQLLVDYVARMLKRPRQGATDIHYTSSATERYLTWLAQQMQAHGLVVFQLERLQPDWALKQRTARMIGGVLAGLIIGLSVAALTISGSFYLPSNFAHQVFDREFYGLTANIDIGPLFWAISAVIVGLFYGIISGQYVRRKKAIALRDQIRFSRNNIRTGVRFGVGAFILVLFVLGGNFLQTTTKNSILTGIFKIIYYAFGTDIGGLPVTLHPSFFFILALALSLVIGLFAGCIDALRTGDLEQTMYHYPNEGVVRTVQNWLRFTLISGLIVGLSGGVGVGFTQGFIQGIVQGLETAGIIVFFGGLLLGAFTGMDSVCLYIGIRYALFFERVAPLNYARFLNYAASHILLQKDGGRYRFIHKVLLDYFARLPVK